VKAAEEVARRYGLRFDRGRVLGDYSNTIVKLDPLPVVARVATAVSSVRPGVSWLVRELAIATYLADHGAAVARPSGLIDPGPHEAGGLNLTYWSFVEIDGRSTDPSGAARSLFDLHARLADYPGDLPRMAVLEEVDHSLRLPLIAATYSGDERKLLANVASVIRRRLCDYRLVLRPLHGDAHHGNLWSCAGRPVWGDFEDTFAGPVEWDLACLVTSSRVLGTGRAADAALRAYPAPVNEELLDILVDLRTLQAILWMAIALPDPRHGERFQARLRRLAGRFGAA
jgi:hypothetical protein